MKPRENKTKLIRIRNVKVMVLKNKKKKKNQPGSRPANVRLVGWSLPGKRMEVNWPLPHPSPGH